MSRKIFAAIFLFVSVSPFFLGAEPPQLPPGSSVDALEARVKEEAKKKLEEKKLPPAPSVEEKRPEELKDPGIAFSVERIHLDSDQPPPISLENFRPLLSQYENREIHYSDIKNLEHQIERTFRARGFFAVVYTPPQTVEKEITLKLLLSKMGDLSIEGARYFRQSKMRPYWKLPKGSALRYDKILQSVYFLNENPDRTARPVLVAGKEPGTTDVYLKVQDHFPLHASYSFDNRGIKLTGKDRTGVMLRHNNFLSLDDIFQIGTIFGNRYGALYLNHLIPLTSFGTRLVWGFSHAQVDPKKEFTSLGINGTAETYSLGLRQLAFRKENSALDTYLGFDFKEKRTKQQSVTSVWDRLRVLSFGADYQRRDKSGIWSVGQDFFFSVSPHGDGFPLNSRQAETNFFKYGFFFERQQQLPLDTKAIGRFAGQLSPSSLVPQEQLFLGGAATVRGYPESDYGADQGFYGNLEYWIPFLFAPEDLELPYAGMPLREQIQALVFLDHGYGRLHRPSSSEERWQAYLGIGGGFKIQFRRNIAARFEWGAPLLNEAITEGGESQFHFRLDVSI